MNLEPINPSPSSIQYIDPGPIAGLIILFLIGLVVVVASFKNLQNRCLHLPFVSLSFFIVFTYAAVDVSGQEAPWLITTLGITIGLWIIATAIYYAAHFGKSYTHNTLDINDTNTFGLDDGL
tara:strand:- start:438 stop:803 length:366 start_codon:yes stop_codon:yes gene_type:complete